MGMGWLTVPDTLCEDASSKVIYNVYCKGLRETGQNSFDCCEYSEAGVRDHRQHGLKEAKKSVPILPALRQKRIKSSFPQPSPNPCAQSLTWPAQVSTLPSSLAEADSEGTRCISTCLWCSELVTRRGVGRGCGEGSIQKKGKNIYIFFYIFYNIYVIYIFFIFIYIEINIYIFFFLRQRKWSHNFAVKSY